MPTHNKSSLMSKVLLIGIGGTYNYGCEAIIRGTVNILKKYNPEIQISYASYNYLDDVKRLKGCDIEIINRTKSERWFLHRVIKKVLSYFRLNYSIPFDDLSFIKRGKYDTLFSIGGDMYTLNKQNRFSESLPAFCEMCKNYGVKYILWGASVGPFYENKKAEKYFKNHLLKVDLIVARENHTIEYLKSIGVWNNVVFAPDPAFFVVNDNQKKSDDLSNIIGINLSPLSGLYNYETLEKGVELQCKTIQSIVEKLGKKILLIPHVVSHNIYDDDFNYLKKIYSNLPFAVKEKVYLVDNDPGFIGLKEWIKQCDLIFSARMHCGINAVTSGIQTVFISYSSKSKGMSNYIYGGDSCFINLKEFEDENKIKDLLTKKQPTSRVSSIIKFDFTKILDRITIDELNT